MNETDLRRTVERVASALATLGIRFHLTGGLASSFYGEPRTTRDADFVVSLSPGDVRPLVDALSGGFLINEAAVREAVGQGGMFQALDQETTIKADFHVGELIPGELMRSEKRELFEGLAVPLVSKRTPSSPSWSGFEMAATAAEPMRWECFWIRQNSTSVPFARAPGGSDAPTS